ncbi:hypothetical protein RND81_03G215000 [Saponaria officinalis]|uniref:Transcription factor CBF/NF-Y/archaeal histone domain-containing protein n=1 Tax=Saponaria officinalis TaxID=3572 RepID=A0AAW1M995_SAPOF
MYLTQSTFYLFSGTRAKVSNVDGIQNGLNTNISSISAITGPRSQTQSGAGKKNATKTPNNINGAAGQCREHDPYLPTANVVRLMRRALPTHAKVADEAKEMVQECVSEFISFLTTEANETCQKEHRKTITAEDLIAAMSRLGFDRYVEPLTLYLQKYRENEMLPMINRYNVPHVSNTGPGYDSVPSGLPPFAMPSMVHPQCAVFGSGNGVYYNDGSGGPSSGAGNMGLDSTAGTAYGENWPGLARGINSGKSGGDGTAGPSVSPQAKMAFYDPYRQY